MTADGLGVRHAKDLNRAFMMKVGWGLIEKKDSLWSKVLRAKYSCGNDIIPLIRRRKNESNLWKGICSTWKDVQANSIWRIGSLNKLHTQVRGWNIDKLKSLLLEMAVQKIVAMSPPSACKKGDQVAWANSSDGTFFLKSAYNSLQENQTFGVILSSLWYSKNKYVFEEKSFHPNGVARSIVSRNFYYALMMKANITSKKTNTDR
ncbi:hypothetical protein Ahy_A05g022723 [Arachis hypogaea]|uniref:Reverse transcriptase zinc-binding domain-containing protein n=1 Tax=Arachis hypogaea TaxID=3818 RepID=A0A445D1N7_ARAHY|nr:hypothetical protein Ahy_A05g022723 [Arachis hypogaea]